ncbi:hypothetical protein ACG873_30250 [Mesorhizobium sp. AaZ16]|uniref:hypothetical protein n=1 Tax=Mesorhizobium sp. AaZ16 TaxID=3402289 RepID=UPI00374F21AD
MSKTSATTVVPSLAEVSDDYARLIAKKQELQSTHTDLQVERRAIEKRMQAQVGTVQPNAEVARLLGDETAGIPYGEDRKRLQQILTMVRDIEQALVTLEGRIAIERGKASKLVCQKVERTYADHVGAICTALITANQKHRDLVQMVDALEREDVAWTGFFYPMQPVLLGGATDSQSRLAFYLREACQNGFLAGDAIPKEFR